MTFCREEITTENVTILHLRPLLNPKYCAWAESPDDDYNKRGKQRQLTQLIGDNRTSRGKEKIQASNSKAMCLESALVYFGHDYAIKTELQTHHLVQYLELRAASKVEISRPITCVYGHMRANLTFLREVVHVQGHMETMALPSNWRFIPCVKNAMQYARDRDYKQ